MRASRTGIIVSALPSAIMLALFYSLAVHMHHSLGAWPTSIGNRGFPAALVTHEQVTWSYFSALLLFSLFVLPVGILVCLFVARWRRLVPYFALYGLLYLVCWGLILLAPASFLSWWWD